MSNVAVTTNRILPMSDVAIDKVRLLEKELENFQQVELDTGHLLHAGMYARTLFVPAGTTVAGVLIKIATILIVSGDGAVWVDGKAVRLVGYNVFAASAHRKQAYVAITDSYITMLFPTSAIAVDEAEKQFTDEFDALLSRRQKQGNTITITGE